MKTILIIDDEAYFAESVGAVLDPKKYKIITAGDGEEGLEMIEKNTPDAVLLDLSMPKMSGMEMLKKFNNTKKIPIIITSNLSSRETISEGVELGVRGYIIKSNETPRTIADTIEDLFK